MQAGAAPQLQQLQDGGTQRAQGRNRASSMACLALPHLHQQKPPNLAYLMVLVAMLLVQL